jgi:hypothetical protein
MAGHLNLRQFKCDVCDKTFNQRSKLRTHRFVHENTPTFNCHICECKYKYKWDLKTHIWRVHGN